MRHRILTCKNHPNLRWSTKDVAWTNGDGYNGTRSLFFTGVPSGEGMYQDGSGLNTTLIDPATGEIVAECDCLASDLVLAPEDELVVGWSPCPSCGNGPLRSVCEVCHMVGFIREGR